MRLVTDVAKSHVAAKSITAFCLPLLVGSCVRVPDTTRAELSNAQIAHRGPASEHKCDAGMFWIDADGHYYDTNSTAQNRVPCPENCADFPDFPGYDSTRPGTFSRDQDTVGLCSAFSTSDFLCHQMKTLGQMPKDGSFESGCSALDLEVMAYATATLPSREKKTIKKFLKQSGDKGYTYSTASFRQVAEKYGVCPESVFPSEFRNSKHKTLKELYTALDERLRALKKTEAVVSLEGTCPECEEIAPTLTKDQWRVVSKVLARVEDPDEANFQALQKINELACPPNKRVKVQLPSEIKEYAPKALEIRLKKKGSIALLGLPARVLEPRIRSDLPDGHTVVVFGTVRGVYEGKPVCYYAVKNSWGPQACSSCWGKDGACLKSVPPGEPPIKCLEDGSDGTYLIPHTTLFQTALEVEW